MCIKHVHLPFRPRALAAGRLPLTSVPRPSAAARASAARTARGQEPRFPDGFPRRWVNPVRAAPSPALLHAATPAPGAREEGVPTVSPGPEPGPRFRELVPPAPPECGPPHPPRRGGPGRLRRRASDPPSGDVTRQLTALSRVGARFKSSRGDATGGMGPPCPGEARRAEAPRRGPGASQGPAGRVGVWPERDRGVLGPAGALAPAAAGPGARAEGGGGEGASALRQSGRGRGASARLAGGKILPGAPPGLASPLPGAVSWKARASRLRLCA